MNFPAPPRLYLWAANKEILLAARDDSPTTPPTPPRGELSTIEIAVRGRIGSSDGAVLCELVRALLYRSRTRAIVCDVGRVREPDLGTLDALARAQLTARRLGSSLWLRGASSELREMLALAGLCEVLPCSTGLRLEARGEAEEREESRGVEEERDPADPTR